MRSRLVNMVGLGAGGPCRARAQMDREPVPREEALQVGSVEASVDGIMAGSSLRALAPGRPKTPEDENMCPYLRVGELRNSCAAYIGPGIEPSVFEQEYYCGT